MNEDLIPAPRYTMIVTRDTKGRKRKNIIRDGRTIRVAGLLSFAGKPVTDEGGDTHADLHIVLKAEIEEEYAMAWSKTYGTLVIHGRRK